MLDIGIRVPCYRRWCGPVEIRDIAQAAEELGYASLWVQDHVVAPVGSGPEAVALGQSDWMTPGVVRPALTAAQYYAGDDWWLDPYAVWGFLAAATSTVRLASDVVVVPYRNPIVQAKMLGTLDVLSQGRMILGAGSGHVRGESNALGLDFDARARAHDEYLQIIKLVLSSPEVSFDGEFYRFGPIRTLIKPVQQPHPPIWVGGNGRRAIRRAVEFGDGWLPSMVDPDGLARGIDALRVACERAGRAELPTVALSLPSAFRRLDDIDAVVSTLRRYAEVGVAHVALSFAMPNASVYLELIERFAREILPAVSSD